MIKIFYKNIYKNDKNSYLDYSLSVRKVVFSKQKIKKGGALWGGFGGEMICFMHELFCECIGLLLGMCERVRTRNTLYEVGAALTRDEHETRSSTGVERQRELSEPQPHIFSSPHNYQYFIIFHNSNSWYLPIPYAFIKNTKNTRK